MIAEPIFILPLDSPLTQFSFLILVALLVRLALERTRFPAIVGLLLVGIAVGPGGLGILAEGDVINLLAALGLLYIMFLAGLEVDLHMVRANKAATASFGLLGFSLSLIPAVVIGLAAGLDPAGALLVGAALASHVLLAYPMIIKMGLLHHRPVVTVVGGTLLTDTLALIMLVIVVRTATGDAGAVRGEGALGWMLPLALLAFLSATALVVLPRLAARLFDLEITRAEKALFVFAVLLLLSLGTNAIGTEAILGAFIAGLCLNRPLHKHDDTRSHVEFVGSMLFLPFFFVHTGMRLEVEVLIGNAETWGLAGLMVGAVLLGKSAASFLCAKLFDYSRTDALAMIGLSTPQAAATLAVVLTGAETGLLGAQIVDAIIITIFITCLIGPLLTQWSGTRISMAAKAHPSEEKSSNF